MKRSQPRRDWEDALDKIQEEPACRVCGARAAPAFQAAHVIGRRHDQPKPNSKTLWVNPDSVVKLCEGCHRLYDAHRVDILHTLSLAEQLQAVRDAGGIENARIRTCPSQYKKAAA